MIAIKIFSSRDSDVNELLSCYDDANLLFDEKYRALGTVEIIRQVMEDSNTYHYVLDGEIIGWISFGIIDEMSLLNALYVKRKYHGKHISNELMDFYINEVHKKQIKFSVLSYLKIAFWAGKFYKKFAYKDFLELENIESEQVIEYVDKNKENHSTLMIRKIESFNNA